MSSLLLALRNPALLVLMLGHFTNDLFGGILPLYMPVMKERFDLSNAAVGLAILAYSSMSSLSQPLFGYISDRRGRRWYIAATLVWSATFVGLYGFANTYPALLVLAALAGLGSGAYHPLGASTAAQVSEPRFRNAAMSLYTVAGSVGWGLGPVVAVALLAWLGPPGSVVLVVPGLVVAGLLYQQMGMVDRVRQARATVAATVPEPLTKPAWGELSRVMLVTMLRYWTFHSIIQFVPVWYSEQGYEASFYGPLVTLIIFAGATGTLLGGAFADRIGSKRIVVVTLSLLVPALLLFVGFPGPLAFATGIAVGMLSEASLSVTLVMAQELVPGRVGVTSGVILGLGFVTGGIGVPVTGRLADSLGMQSALFLLAVPIALAIGLALTLPADRERSRLNLATAR